MMSQEEEPVLNELTEEKQVSSEDEPISSEEEPALDELAEEEEEEEEEENICIRAKWSIDDASSIDEAIEKLQNFIKYLNSLKEEGWEFRDPVSDDYGFLYKKQ